MYLFRFRFIIAALVLGVSTPGLAMDFGIQPDEDYEQESIQIDLKRNKARPTPQQKSHAQQKPVVNSEDTVTPKKPGLWQRTAPTWLGGAAQSKKSYGLLSGNGVVDTESLASIALKLNDIAFKIEKIVVGTGEIRKITSMKNSAEQIAKDLEEYTASIGPSAQTAGELRKKASKHYAKSIEPRFNEIQKTIAEIQHDLQKTPLDQEQSDADLKHRAAETHDVRSNYLKGISDNIDALIQLVKPSLGLGVATTLVKHEMLISPGFTKGLTKLINSIETTRIEFVKMSKYSGIAATLDDTIKNLKDSLDAVGDRLAMQLKHELRHVIGFTGIINIQAQLDILISSPDLPKNIIHNKLKSIVITQELLHEFEDTDLEKPLTDLSIALNSVVQEYKENWTHEELQSRLFDAQQIINDLVKTKGGLAAIAERLAENFKQVADKLGNSFKQSTESLGNSLDKTVDQTLPRTAKKMTCYAILGALGLMTMNKFAFKKHPTNLDYAKGFGGLCGSVALMPVVDWVFNKFCAKK